MREARVDGRLVMAGPNSPKMAVCPSCGEEVEKRKRRGSDGKATWFWRHKVGTGDGCALRYTPVRG